MFIMYKAVNRVVTELFIYSEQDNLLLESKVAPYNEMDLHSRNKSYQDDNPAGSFRKFRLALNKPISIHDRLYIDEKDITCFTHFNKFPDGGYGKRTEEIMQVGGRIKL